MGFRPTSFVPKTGLAGGYALVSTGLRMFINGNSAAASKYLTKGVGLLKPTLSYDQMNYLFTEFLILYVCSDPSLACSSTTAGSTPITSSKELQTAFPSFADSVSTVPLMLPSSPGYTIPEPAFKNLLTALVKSNGEGAPAILAQLTPQHIQQIKYAIDTMSATIGIDSAYLTPYGLLAPIEHLKSALQAIVDNGAQESAITELHKIFLSKSCVSAFGNILPTAADSLLAYVSKFFDDPTLFRDVFGLPPNPASANMGDAAYACKSGTA
ncbi:hypothetical protein EC991_000759 [Linnemannia zychae]|nr:hypothetical protein EC991_000759 [Linnemannia zychae]